MQKKSHLNIKSLDPSDRPREKLAMGGSGSLSSSELLAILIGSGSRSESAVQLCQRILKSVDQDLGILARKSLKDLQQFKGIGEAKAITIMAALELGKRRLSAEVKPVKKVSSSQAAFQLMRDRLIDKTEEEFWVILLSRSNVQISQRCISRGGVAHTVVDTKVLLKYALEHLASSIILCHNHPSGQLKPSKADIELTKKICEGARFMDIKVLDHIIVGASGYFSFADNNIVVG